MSVRTTTYVMVGADVGSKLADRYPNSDAEYEALKVFKDERTLKAGQVAIAEDYYGSRYTRVGMLLADPMRDDEWGSIDVEVDPERLAAAIPAARAMVAAQLDLDIDPRLLVFTNKS